MGAVVVVVCSLEALLVCSTRGRRIREKRKGGHTSIVRILLRTNVVVLDDVSALGAALDGAVAGDLLPFLLALIPFSFGPVILGWFEE